ncbi:MAG: glycosyltransferase [Phaeovulum sp.]|uniref:glycosyltransferase n=1 Tax=Phaeovulum sp. TaxID=2934796 RepID=UPI002734EDBD|nr:glycosyltransferase [Phaeovulum sp.]MDP3860638.1 glycosyltransferase [Phaeovulum sp.]
MRILFYNWAQFDDAGMAGGGVTVYLRNVIEELLRREVVEVWFLSSGHLYRNFDRRVRIVPTPNAYDHPRLKTFALLNSPIKATAHDAFYAIDRWASDDVSVGVIREFLRANGPFDVVHLHNLEGVGAGVLRLPRGEDAKRLFYTLHNCMAFCPQVELLYDGRQRCTDYREGYRCVGCLGYETRMFDLIAMARAASVVNLGRLAGHPLGWFVFGMQSAAQTAYRAVRNLFKDLRHGFRTRFGHWQLGARKGSGKRYDWRATPDTPRLRAQPLDRRAGLALGYRNWRQKNAAALAENLDGLFAVSDLLRSVALPLLPEGTNVETLALPIDIETTAEDRAGLRARRVEATEVTLSFVGYDTAAKGLAFLIEALTDLDDPFYREKVSLLVVARLGSHRARQLYQLERQFKSVRVIRGYRRDQLQELSGMIDLNVVPSICWETFNQVTVELARLGVPSLVSSTVGAKQAIADQETFVFESGDAADFRRKLDALVKNGTLRARFFETELAIPSVREHVDLLLARYARE